MNEFKDIMNNFLFIIGVFYYSDFLFLMQLTSRLKGFLGVDVSNSPRKCRDQPPCKLVCYRNFRYQG